MRIQYIVILIIAAFLGIIFLTSSKNSHITFMATTTTQDAGLLSVLIPEMSKDTGLDIQVVAFGTGKVLRSAAEGNADIILVHDPVAEKDFMAAGYGTERFSIMRNDFVIVGPGNDPAKIRESNSAAQAFTQIAQSNQSFVSRGDNSGTHQAEIRIWQSAKINPETKGSQNYIETGAGMGRTLNIASQKSAYLLTDRATWLAFQNKGELDILFSEDILFENIYSIILVNPDISTHISPEKQQRLASWLRSEKAEQIIRQFQPNGEQLFYPLNIIQN